MSKTITIIDTFGFFFRSFYALPPLTNKNGFPTGLLTGFTHLVERLEKDHATDYLVFALDSKGPTFRNDIDPNYKANRSAPPEELTMQLPIAIEWIKKMGFHSIAMPGFEADDVIASLTIEAKKKGYKVKVVSHDKDLYQLIDDNKVVLLDAIKRKEINEEECFDKYGIHPCQFTDYQAILGDSADNVPGVKGIGKVGAQKLLSQYETLKNVYAHIDEIKPPGMQKKLREFEKDAWMSHELVTLRTDILEGIDFTPFALPKENPFLPIYDELVEYEMNGILRVLHAKKLVDPDTRPTTSGSKPKTADEVMAAMAPKTLDLETKLVTDENELHSLLKDLKAEDIVAFDTETTGLEHAKDHMVGFSFALNEEIAYYVPIAHFYLGVPEQVSTEAAQKALRKIFSARVIGHNVKFDMHFVADYLGVETLNIYGDSIVLGWLVNPESKLSLDHLASVWLEHTMISFKDTVKKGETFASVELEDATKYAAEDALITLKLYNMLLEKLKLQSAEHLIELAHTLEFPFITTLMEMERNGIASDAKSLESFKEEAKTKLAELTKSIYEAAGGEFNINSPKQLGDILFDKLELPFGKKRSTDIKVLNSLLGSHPIIEYIMQYREMFKLYSTYIEPLLELNKQSKDGRIHTSFVQTRTATGRLSSVNPNLQNIPTRSELGARIRGAFVAPEGKLLIGIDYSQIELRLLAHFSEDSVLVDAFNDDKDIHMQTAIVLFGEEEASGKRSIAKTVNFGLLYGMGPKKLSDTLGITTKEAKTIIEKYFESFPTVKQYFASIVERSKEEGYVETLLRRRRYFDYASAVPMMKAAYEREAVNTVFQGSAADLIKMSMNKIAGVIKTRQLPVKMMLQIHDELIFEVDADKAEFIADEFKAIMEGITELKIPLKTSVNIGKHWGELK